MPTTTLTRREIAERIVAKVREELAFELDVERLLTDAVHARDVLLVCDACRGSDLVDLAAAMREVSTAPVRPVPRAAPGHAARPIEWSRVTSGFGTPPPTQWTSSPMPDDFAATAQAPEPERRRMWSTRWRRDFGS